MNDLVRTGPAARACDLGDEIAAAAEEIERTQRIPEPLLTRLHEARLFRLLLPRSLGGEEVAPQILVRALGELARHDASVAWCVSIANSTALIAAFLDPEPARTIFGDPRATIAWGPPNESTAIAVPGGCRVSGRWDFASGCRHSSWLGAHCPVIEPDQSLRQNRFGRPAVVSFLFPATEATLLDNWDPIGLRGTASESYTTREVFVPDAFTSTREDPEARREPGALYAFPQQTLYSVGISSVALGIARGMLEAFIELACQKTPRGMARLADNTVVQSEVARAEAKLGAAFAYLTDTVEAIHAGAAGVAAISIPQRARVRLAGVNAIHSAVEVADLIYKAAGVDAIFTGSPFERRFRDIHTLSQQIQSRSAHFETIGQVLLGTPPAVFL
jgi:alkylation response protein AidB-like acyl-CoA dehydrogenase